jgi:hypothetical protein
MTLELVASGRADFRLTLIVRVLRGFETKHAFERALEIGCSLRHEFGRTNALSVSRSRP